MGSNLPVPRFEIGQTVWAAEVNRIERRLPCPDCLGTGRWRVVTQAGAYLTVACQRCARGYSGLRTPAGQELPPLVVHDYTSRVRALTIVAVRVYTADDPPVQYLCHETEIGNSLWGEHHLYVDEAGARAEAERLVVAQNTEVAAEPTRIEQMHFARMSVLEAAQLADWNSVYEAWAVARWHQDTLNNLTSEGDAHYYPDHAAIVEYLEQRSRDLSRYDFIHRHPLEVLLNAALELDPVAPDVEGGLVARLARAVAEKFPLPEASRRVLARAEKGR